MPNIWLYESNLVISRTSNQWYSRATVERIQNEQEKDHIPKIARHTVHSWIGDRPTLPLADH